MRRYNVECVCTTDDPIDDLRYHKQTRESGFEIKMIPAWRPDKAMAVDNTKNFAEYVNKLGEVAGVSIAKFQDMIDALQKRHDFFHENGCRLSDHGIEEFYDEPYTDSQIEIIFEKLCAVRSFHSRKFVSSSIACLQSLLRWIMQATGHSSSIMEQSVITTA